MSFAYILILIHKIGACEPLLRCLYYSPVSRGESGRADEGGRDLEEDGGRDLTDEEPRGPGDDGRLSEGSPGSSTDPVLLLWRCKGGPYFYIYFICCNALV